MCCVTLSWYWKSVCVECDLFKKKRKVIGLGRMVWGHVNLSTTAWRWREIDSCGCEQGNWNRKLKRFFSGKHNFRWAFLLFLNWWVELCVGFHGKLSIVWQPDRLIFPGASIQQLKWTNTKEFWKFTPPIYPLKSLKKALSVLNPGIGASNAYKVFTTPLYSCLNPN